MATAARSIAQPAASDAPESGANAGALVLAVLRRRILNWHYPPGHHLGEQALCAEFSTSRVPIREALQGLAEQGLVDKVPNQGCFVKQPDVREIDELYEMRLALELHVGDCVAEKGLPADWVAAQRAFWEPMLAVLADQPVNADDLVEADTGFHLGLARAAGNQRIVETLEEIDERLRFVRLAAITTPHRFQDTAGEHLAILEAILAHDAAAVRRTLRQNINHARNKVELAIGRALMVAHSRKR